MSKIIDIPKSFLMLPLLLVFAASLSADFSEVEDKGIIVANPDKVSKAVSHYKRSRMMILNALREFDKGAAVASPEVLLDIQAWREKLIQSANDLNVIIDPQPRVSTEGITHDPSVKIFDNLK